MTSMDSKILDALKGSIKKWEKIVDGTGYDDGAENCPLCHLFLRPWSNVEQDCIGCPVMAKSGSKYCNNTPYRQWQKHQLQAGPFVASCRTCSAIARAELDFLKSLLPEPPV